MVPPKTLAEVEENNQPTNRVKENRDRTSSEAATEPTPSEKEVDQRPDQVSLTENDNIEQLTGIRKLFGLKNDFWSKQHFIWALVVGAVVGLIIIIVVIFFICHNMKKSDEGSYIVDKKYSEKKTSPPSQQQALLNGQNQNSNNNNTHSMRRNNSSELSRRRGDSPLLGQKEYFA